MYIVHTWYGHINRPHGLANIIMQGTVDGGRKQGRHFSFFQGGGKILTDFLRGGGAKYEKKQKFVGT